MVLAVLLVAVLFCRQCSSVQALSVMPVSSLVHSHGQGRLVLAVVMVPQGSGLQAMQVR